MSVLESPFSCQVLFDDVTVAYGQDGFHVYGGILYDEGCHEHATYFALIHPEGRKVTVLIRYGELFEQTWYLEEYTAWLKDKKVWIAEQYDSEESAPRMLVDEFDPSYYSGEEPDFILRIHDTLIPQLREQPETKVEMDVGSAVVPAAPVESTEEVSVESKLRDYILQLLAEEVRIRYGEFFDDDPDEVADLCAELGISDDELAPIADETIADLESEGLVWTRVLNRTLTDGERDFRIILTKEGKTFLTSGETDA